MAMITTTTLHMIRIGELRQNSRGSPESPVSNIARLDKDGRGWDDGGYGSHRSGYLCIGLQHIWVNNHVDDNGSDINKVCY